MLHNRKGFALNRLFEGCGFPILCEREKRKYKRFGRFGVIRLQRACYSYVGKTRQAFELQENLTPQDIFFIEYDDLVQKKDVLLPLVYRFIGLSYKDEYANGIHNRSLGRIEQLSRKEEENVDRICLPIYEKARSTLTPRWCKTLRPQPALA
jgi:hypothetical protein